MVRLSLFVKHARSGSRVWDDSKNNAKPCILATQGLHRNDGRNKTWCNGRLRGVYGKSRQAQGEREGCEENVREIVGPHQCPQREGPSVHPVGQPDTRGLTRGYLSDSSGYRRQRFL